MQYKIEQHERLTGEKMLFEGKTTTEALRSAENDVMDRIQLLAQFSADIRHIVRARLTQSKIVEVNDNEWINQCMLNQV